jgi:HlyD family secretion protein
MRGRKWPSLLVLPIGMLAVYGCTDAESKASRVESTPAPQQALPRIAASTIRGTCTLRPEKIVRLKAQTGGEVANVPVRQGDTVALGQTLATIDTSALLLRRQRAETDLKRAQLNIEYLSFLVARSEKQFEATTGKDPSDATVARFGNEMASVMEKRHSLREAEITKEQVKLDMEGIDQLIQKSRIRAPFPGVILSRFAEPGMVVGSGSEGFSGGDVLFEVADPSRLVAECVVRETEALSFREGSKAAVALDGHEARLSGVVSSLSPLISNDGGLARRSFLVRLRPDDSVEIVPGMNGIVEVDRNE